MKLALDARYTVIYSNDKDLVASIFSIWITKGNKN